MSGWTSKRALYENAFFGSIVSPASTDGWFTGVRFFSLRTFGSVSLTIAFATSFATCESEEPREHITRRLTGPEPFDVRLLAEVEVGLVDLSLARNRRGFPPRAP